MSYDKPFSLSHSMQKEENEIFFKIFSAIYHEIEEWKNLKI